MATPIGNLEDITLRALRVLREVDAIAAEDTRQARKLLTHFQIAAPRLISYREENRQQAAPQIVDLLQRGHEVALMTDAGMPGISDPGPYLVNLCHQHGIAVSPLPGASSLVAGVAAAGLEASRVAFEGFLSRRSSHRRQRLLELAAEPRLMVLFEAPSRVADTLQELAGALGQQRSACVARELTKKFEEIRRGTLGELAEWAASHSMRGEFTILVEGCGDTESQTALDPMLLLQEALSRGLSKKEAAREVATKSGRPVRELYQMMLD